MGILSSGADVKVESLEKQFGISAWRCLPKRNETLCAFKDLFTNVHSVIIQSSQK